MSARRPILVLDAGALLAVERRQARVRALLSVHLEAGGRVVVPAGVVAQAWRGSPRQAMVAKLLSEPVVSIDALDGPRARAVGVLCGRAGSSDVVDAHVALTARENRAPVATSDPDDLRALDAGLTIVSL